MELNYNHILSKLIYNWINIAIFVVIGVQYYEIHYFNTLYTLEFLN